MDCTKLFEKIREAGRKFDYTDVRKIDAILMDVADTAVVHCKEILEANSRDLSLMEETDPKYDRLKLTEERIKGIASDTRSVASLPSPTDRLISQFVRPDGLSIKRISVPFGVIGVIYEARPNVTFDVFSLCLKSGNACILKGGSDAIHSNTAIVNLIRKVIVAHGADENLLTLLPAGREETNQLLNARGYVDLLIPRGGQELISFVRKNAGIPIIETGAGICHTYFEETGDIEKGRKIILNAKTRRVSVCNALDCMIIDRRRLSDLALLVEPLVEKNVVIYADVEAWAALNGSYPQNLLCHATEESFGKEFLDYKMAVKTVGNIDKALEHIARYSSKHSEAIISENQAAIDLFRKMVDAAAVYSNTSTAFTDGAQFGLGAEIGISTQKLHARGPMALEALCTYKWIIEGDGQIRVS